LLFKHALAEQGHYHKLWQLQQGNYEMTEPSKEINEPSQEHDISNEDEIRYS